MGTPHKHADLIKAWADGAKIELNAGSKGWVPIDNPMWNQAADYRIKPAHKWQKEMDACRNGAIIQYQNSDGDWYEWIWAKKYIDLKTSTWYMDDTKLRIKPESVVRKVEVHLSGRNAELVVGWDGFIPNVEFTFEDGKLMDAKVIEPCQS